MTRSLVGTAVLAILMSVSPAESRAVQPVPCPPDQSHAFDFIVGQWQGKLYELKGTDSTLSDFTAIDTAAKTLNGCALEEHWHFWEKGAPESDVVILRAFDAPSKAWHYTGFGNTNNYFTYDGQRDGALWRFYHSGTIDGKPAHIRISWVEMPWGYSEQIARSTDGTTWMNTRHWNFTTLKM
jgi:hypothetical protein